MSQYKEDIVTFLVIAATFLFFTFTPGRETLGPAVQGFIMALIFFALLPLGYHFLVLKKSAAELGLGKNAWMNGVVFAFIGVAIALAVTVLCSYLLPTFRASFSLPSLAENSFTLFVLYELLLVPVLLALYEIFFRGFIQKSWLQKYLGVWTIFVQSAIFGIFLLMTGSFTWAAFPLMLFSLFSGFLVWKNGSLIQAWLAGWLYLLLFDIFLLITR